MSSDASRASLTHAEAVYVRGSGVSARWQGTARLTVLDTAFGDGSKFLATWRAWRADARRPSRLDYLAVATFADVDHLPTDLLTTVPKLAAWLRAPGGVGTRGCHRLELRTGDEAFVLTLGVGEPMALIPQFDATPDLIYLDGDDTRLSAALLRELAWMCAADSVCIVAPENAALGAAAIAAGLAVSASPGSAPAIAAPPPARPPQAPALVIGAGLAGCLVAERLAARGRQVTLLERQPGPAMETSGNLTAALLPVLSLDDNRLSRLNRAAYLYAIRTYAAWAEAGAPNVWHPCGVLQIARDPAHAAKQQDIVRRNRFPAAFARAVTREDGTALAGAVVADGGWWFSGGGWVHPPAVCAAALAAHPGRINACYSSPVARLVREGDDWEALDAHGALLGRAPTVVLAGATEIARIEQAAHVPVFRFRGQVTHLDADPGGAGLRAVVCREGYLTPAFAGVHCVGASFHRSDEPALRDSDHQANLARLARMLPDFLPPGANLPLAGRVGFRPVSPDKVPIVGSLYRGDVMPQGRDLSGIPRWPGLYVATGYGARGAVWAPLMAELLASQIAGDALPVEADLAGSVDPARFLARTVREQQFSSD